MPTNVTILQAAELPPKADEALKANFDVIVLPKGEAAAGDVIARHGARIRGIAVRHFHMDRALFDQLPNLEVISSYSAGLDGIDLDEAHSRGIAIHNTSEILAGDVADLAVALAISVTRGTVRGHDFVRSGAWPTGGFPLGRSLSALNAGIVGLGHIGAAIARRLSVMGAPIAYFGPRRKPVDMPYFDTIGGLAAWADLLIVTCPANADTVGLIDASVLDALGPEGFLVNIARGTIVDEAALIEALARNGIAGAGLDVFQDEPHVPEALRGDPRVVLSPHMGSGTLETRERMGESMVAALMRHFGGH